MTAEKRTRDRSRGAEGAPLFLPSSLLPPSSFAKPYGFTIRSAKLTNPYSLALTLFLTRPYYVLLPAPLVARIVSLGLLRRSSCLSPPWFLTPFPFGPREGVVGVLSEGWRCRAPVAARTLNSGFLPSSRAFFSVPPLRVSLSLYPCQSKSRDSLDTRDTIFPRPL